MGDRITKGIIESTVVHLHAATSVGASNDHRFSRSHRVPKARSAQSHSQTATARRDFDCNGVCIRILLSRSRAPIAPAPRRTRIHPHSRRHRRGTSSRCTTAGCATNGVLTIAPDRHLRADINSYCFNVCITIAGTPRQRAAFVPHSTSTSRSARQSTPHPRTPPPAEGSPTPITAHFAIRFTITIDSRQSSSHHVSKCLRPSRCTTG